MSSPYASKLRPPKSKIQTETAFFGRDDVADFDSEEDMITRNQFLKLKRGSLDGAISDAESDGDEVVILPDDIAAADDTSIGTENVAELDELELLQADTPLRKLQHREKDAKNALKGGDTWGCLQLRQEALALCKLYGPTGPYAGENRHPMLLSDAHFKLAKTYSILQCMPQAHDHCIKALEAMPTHGMTNDKIISFKKDVNLLMGESFILSSPPKPQAALQYLCASDGCSDPDSILDPGTRVLVAHCYALMGAAKLQEAEATINAEDALKQREVMLASKLVNLDSKRAEYSQVIRKLDETRSELAEETSFKEILLTEAKAVFDKASDIITDIIDREETLLRSLDVTDEERRQHPLIKALFRQACSIFFKLSIVEGLLGDVHSQFGLLENITQNQEVYDCAPAGFMAKTLKEKGKALVSLASTRDDQDMKQDDLKRALATYNDLLDHQSNRFPENSAKQAMAKAETLKLIGNVYVAMRHWNRAQEHFKEAQEMYISYLGPGSNLVADLDSRILEVESYIE